MDSLGATDENAFIRIAKKHGCYLERGGIARINLPELQRCIEEEFSKMQEQAAKRKTIKRDRGSDLGLVEARLTTFPARIDAKKEKIKATEAAMKAADSPYLKRKYEREMETLRAQLAKMEEGYQRDSDRREEILHSDNGVQ
jgi:hypothetical protein